MPRMSALVAVLFLLIGGPVSAQMTMVTGGAESAEETIEPTSPEEAREMVSRMSDAEVRGLLLERLDAVAAQSNADDAAKESGLLDFANHATVGVFNSIIYAIGKTPQLLDQQIKSFTTFGNRLGTMGIVFMGVVMAAAIAAGLIAEQIFYRITRRWTGNSGPTDGARTLRQTVIFLSKRLLADLAGVFVFFFAANFFGPLIGFNLAPVILGESAAKISPMVGAYIGSIWFYLIIIPRMAAAIGRFVLAPNRPEDRLVNADDHTARFFYRNQIRFLFLVGFAMWIFRFNDMNGIEMGESRLGFWLNIAVHGYFAWIVWQVREGMVLMMRGADTDVSPREEMVARFYPYFIFGTAIGAWYLVEIIVTYKLWDLLAGAPQVITMMILSYAPLMDTMIRGLVHHLTPPMTGEGVVATRAYLSAKRSYIRIGRIITFVLVMMTIGEIWGIQFSNLAAAGVGAQFAARFIEILMVVAAGYLVWEVVSLWINRKLAAEMTAAGFDLNDDEPSGGEGGGAGGSRLSTVLPLLLGVMKFAIAMIFGLIALGNIGIDITPLLAGAGIIGLAVGFGAQKLVADVVGGIFFLVDDAFRTGEYVEVEGTVGTVEKISIRSMQLRHHKGPVHTIPYGEIPKITNYSRDWVIMKLKFTVPFDTDPNKVKKLFKNIGKDMMAVPAYAADMMQPFKSQGVFDFDDVGMIIRGKFMAKPGKQFTLRKEIYNRVKAAFDENGIDFARREVRVAIPGLDNAQSLSDGQKSTIAAAAAEAAQAKGEPSK